LDQTNHKHTDTINKVVNNRTGSDSNARRKTKKELTLQEILEESNMDIDRKHMKNTQEQKKVTSRKMTKLRRCFCSCNKTFKYRTEKQKNSDKITKQQNKQHKKDYQTIKW